MVLPPEEFLPSLKILIIGPSNVGKSALLTRYCDDQFDSEAATATIGIDSKVKKLSVHGKHFRVNIFDTAGQERFRTLSTSYYRGAHGVMLVYDVSSRASFDAMSRWFGEAEANTAPGTVLSLVGSKLDRAEAGHRAVSADEGAALAREHGALFCEASAKTRDNVRRAFVELVDAVARRLEQQLLVSGGGGGGAAARRDASGTVLLRSGDGEEQEQRPAGWCSC